MESPFTNYLPAQKQTSEDNLLLPELEFESPFIKDAVDAANEIIDGFSQNDFLVHSGTEDFIGHYESSNPGNEWEYFFQSEINIEKAKKNNFDYSERLLWKFFDLEIYRLLGYTNTSPNEEDFALAVADWQRKNGLSGADGIIGPNTWTAMLMVIIDQTSFTHVNIKAAIAANEKLKKILGWEKFAHAVYKVLGFANMTPNVETFAKAVALWQPKLGFKGSDVDGRLGEKTWAAIRKYVLSEVEQKPAGTTAETPVNYPAVIKGKPGIYLHAKPHPGTKQTDILYPNGQGVTVIALSTIPAEKDWRKIRTNDNRTGWIQDYYLADISMEHVMAGLVKTPPGPYLVKKGDRLDNLVKIFYPDYEIEMGNDRRTIIHAFSILNDGKDGIDYRGTSTTWWRNHVLDRDMADTRRIYETIQLRENRLIYFPSEPYIKMLRDFKIVGVRPDWKNKAIVIGKSIIGFLEGVAKGFVEAGIDTIKGLWDFIKSLFTGELFKQLYDLYKEFEKYTLGEAAGKVWDLIKEIVGNKVDEIKKDFNSKNPYDKFYSIGKLVGYILFEVVVFILTSGTSLAVRFAGKFGKISELLTKSSSLSRVVSKARPALKATVAAWDNAYEVFQFVGLGSATFKAIDAIKDIGVEGLDLSISKMSNETYETEYNVQTEEEDLGNLTGTEAEQLVEDLLRNGDPVFQKHKIPPLDHVIPGQYNKSRHGIDMFGFSVTGDSVKLFIFEIKGGIHPSLPTRINGPQMGRQWIENAIDKALANPELNKKLKEAFKFYYGKNFSAAEIKQRLLKANRKVIVSERSLPHAIKAINKLLKTRYMKKVGLIKREIEEYAPVDSYYAANEADLETVSPFEQMNATSNTYDSETDHEEGESTWFETAPAAEWEEAQGFERPDEEEEQLYEFETNEEDFYGDAETYSALSEQEIADEIAYQAEVAKPAKACEGHVCWAKEVLNRHLGLALAPGNRYDDETKKAIAAFQAKNNLKQTSKIDSVTERALLEADALKKHTGTSMQDAASKIIAEAKTKIEDWTAKAVNNKPQHILNSYRDPRKVWAFVLHQMAFKRRSRTTKQFSDPASYLATGAHFCIMFDGRIIQLHPLTRMIWHGNCISPRSVAVEFEGNFPNIRGTWWIDKKSSVQNKDKPTQAQFDAGRFLTSYLKVVLGTTHILAHRQSSASRENDPGPDIWYNVGQWAIDKLGLTDGGPTFKCGTGNPILPEWRTWGSGVTTKKEYEEEGEEPFGNEAEPELEEEYDFESEAFETDEFNTEEETATAINVSYLNEIDELVKDWAHVIRLNRYYAQKLGWQQYQHQINDVLLPYSGMNNVSLGEEAFAQAVVQWQKANGFSTASADGIIGPATWSVLSKTISKGTNIPVSTTVSVPSSDASHTEKIGGENVVFKRKKLGWAAYGGGDLKARLTDLKQKGLLQISPNEIEMIYLVSKPESGGKVNAINSWDSAYMSMGFIQFTIRYSKLQEVIRQAPEAFRKHGIELDSSKTYFSDEPQSYVVKNAEKPADLRSLEWAVRFYKAGLENDAIIAQVNLARSTLKSRLKQADPANFLRRFENAYPNLWAFIYEANNSRPAVLKVALQNAIEGATKGGINDAVSFGKMLIAELKKATHAYYNSPKRGYKTEEEKRQRIKDELAKVGRIIAKTGVSQ